MHILAPFMMTFGFASNAVASITIPTVSINDPGNAADSTTGFGAVAYVYNIGTYEVTTGQYAAFLNAVAAVDTHALFNTHMSDTEIGCGITRSGASGSYTYTVDAAFVNRPVNYVSFWDATRFANWLHNGQPTGPQSNSTTEDGAYTLTTGGITANTITRNAGWQWAVTSENEWYKAAYAKEGGTNAGYWQYPTGSNTAPERDLADPSGNNANYYSASGAVPIDSPYYTTVAGEFQNSASPYGTFDQGGNVWEWNEAIVSDFTRGLRGGAFNTLDSFLRTDFRHRFNSMREDYNCGFRVAQIPGASSVALLGLGGLVTLRRRR